MRRSAAFSAPTHLSAGPPSGWLAQMSGTRASRWAGWAPPPPCAGTGHTQTVARRRWAAPLRTLAARLQRRVLRRSGYSSQQVLVCVCARNARPTGGGRLVRARSVSRAGSSKEAAAGAAQGERYVAFVGAAGAQPHLPLLPFPPFLAPLRRRPRQQQGSKKRAAPQRTHLWRRLAPARAPLSCSRPPPAPPPALREASSAPWQCAAAAAASAARASSSAGWLPPKDVPDDPAVFNCRRLGPARLCSSFARAPPATCVRPSRVLPRGKGAPRTAACVLLVAFCLSPFSVVPRAWLCS